MPLKIKEGLNIHFPLELTPRDQQIEAVKFMGHSLNRGKKFILLNMPTGSGKSYLAMMFMNWYRNFINPDANFDIITNSKLLQEQYIKDYKSINNLKGKSNYYCNNFDTDCETGMELCTSLKFKCNKCPYISARNKWITGEISLTNFHLFNTFNIFMPEIFDSESRKSNVLIIDEAHDFESVFCDFISFNLNAKSLKKYGFELIDIQKIDNVLFKIKTIEDFVSYIKNQFYDRIRKMDERFTELFTKTNDTSKKKNYLKYSTYIKSQIKKIDNFLLEYERDKTPDEENDPKDNWVLERDINKKEKYYSGVNLSVQPIWAYPYLDKYVWNHYDHVIFMSGTILNQKMFSFINGLDLKKTSYFEMDSDFPIKNRPIFYFKVGKMTYDFKEETFEKQKSFIEKILSKNINNKGIIHTVNYEINGWVQEKIDNNRLTYHDTTNRQEILDNHLDDKKNSVIVSPSMISGVDLKDENSRFQILLKVPYPNIGSKKIKQRQKINPEWYNWKTVVDFIQMYGRSTRSKDDWSETYILDSSFSTLLKYSGHLIPRYISDAIKEIKVKNPD